MKEIDEKYRKVFKEVRMDIQEQLIYKAVADGACGANCTALHCHQNEKLGPQIRKNVNRYLVEFWPFFNPYYTFPHQQNVGAESITFKDDKKLQQIWISLDGSP